MRKYCFAILAAALLCGGCSDKKNRDEKLHRSLDEAKKGQWQTCSATVSELLKESPDDVEAALLQALALEKQGKLDQAMELAMRAADLAPGDFAVLYTCGRICSGDPKRLKVAYDYLEKAHAVRNNDTATLLLLANIGTALQLPGAAVYLEQLLADPACADNPAIRYQYGYLLLKSGNKTLAHRYIAEAAAKSGGNAELLLACARTLDRYYSPQEAVPLYEQIYYSRKPVSPRIKKECNTRIRAITGRYPKPKK